MKYTHKNTQWFTLIELLVSITIFSIIMVSVITIFIFSANLSAKVDINRAMQENIKNAVETMAEDIRKNGIVWVSDQGWIWCSFPTSGVVSWNKLCTWANTYTLSTMDPDPNANETFTRTLNDACIDANDMPVWCSLFLNNASPLTNSFVSFRELNFTISGDGNNQDKVTINFVLQPAVRKWVRSDLIKNSKLVFQTTISERLIESN